jgi:hypothetical protein
MKHRHLVEDAGFALPAIDDMLENGSPADWTELFREVERDPFGDVADKVLLLSGRHPTYGTSNLWREMIEVLRSQR